MAGQDACWTCKYRGRTNGKYRIKCQHPEATHTITTLLEIFIGGKEVTYENKLNIKADPRGILNGWFFWPIEFEPVWLENCDGYESDEEPDEFPKEIE